MPSESNLEQLKESLERLLSFGNKEMISRQEWGALTFEVVETNIKHAFSIARNLDELELTYLPDNEAEIITGCCDEVVGYLQAIDSFNLDVSNPRGERDNHCVNLTNAVEGLTNNAMSWIAYLSSQRGDFSNLLTK